MLMRAARACSYMLMHAMRAHGCSSDIFWINNRISTHTISYLSTNYLLTFQDTSVYQDVHLGLLVNQKEV